MIGKHRYNDFIKVKYVISITKAFVSGPDKDELCFMWKLLPERNRTELTTTSQNQYIKACLLRNGKATVSQTHNLLNTECIK